MLVVTPDWLTSGPCQAHPLTPMTENLTVTFTPSRFPWMGPARRQADGPPARRGPAPRRRRRTCALDRLESRTLMAGSIAGTVFDDVDGDGLRGVGEAGLAGVAVYLDLNRNDQLDGGETSASTGVDGGYRFAGLPAGSYLVAQVAPAGALQSSARGATGVPAVGAVAGGFAADNYL